MRMRTSLTLRPAPLVAALLFVLAMSAAAKADELADIQRAIKAKGAHWTAGHNPNFDRPAAERAALCGGRLRAPRPGQAQYAAAPRDIPATLDWRNIDGKNYVTSIKDQGWCGSCWAFAGVATEESMWAIANHVSNPTINLSEQTLVSCDTANQGCCEGYMDLAAEYLQGVGAPPAADFPYDILQFCDVVEPCSDAQPNWSAAAVKISSWSWVTETGDVAAMENALQDGPLYVWMEVYSDLHSYTGGIYQHVTGNAEGGHNVEIIGYDNNQNYWIAKNSWGPWWGEHGFFRIAIGDSQIGQDAINFVVAAGDDDDDDNDNDDNDDNDNNDDDNDDDSSPPAVHRNGSSAKSGCGG